MKKYLYIITFFLIPIMLSNCNQSNPSLQEDVFEKTDDSRILSDDLYYTIFVVKTDNTIWKAVSPLWEPGYQNLDFEKVGGAASAVTIGLYDIEAQEPYSKHVWVVGFSSPHISSGSLWRLEKNQYGNFVWVERTIYISGSYKQAYDIGTDYNLTACAIGERTSSTKVFKFQSETWSLVSDAWDPDRIDAERYSSNDYAWIKYSYSIYYKNLSSGNWVYCGNPSARDIAAGYGGRFVSTTGGKIKKWNSGTSWTEYNFVSASSGKYAKYIAYPKYVVGGRLAVVTTSGELYIYWPGEMCVKLTDSDISSNVKDVAIYCDATTRDF